MIHQYYESRKRARKNWRQSEKGKAWDKMYARRDYVKNKAHEYYIKNKNREKPQCIQKIHEEWALKNGYRNNDTLNSQNTISFKDGAER
jgi:hypothetical protein|tara:strand:+ start:1220 stop:1486 length:267 start_codon:yes stop_codon:yes gene_type:complete